MAAVIRLGCLALFALLAPAPIATVHLQPAPALATIAQVLVDPTARLTLRDVMAPGAAFVPASSLPPIAEGISPRVYWFRLRLDASGSPQAWALTYAYKVTRIELYLPGSGARPIAAAGFDLARADDALTPGVMVLPPTALRGRLLYLRVASVVDPRSIAFAPLAKAMPIALQRRVTFGFFCGFYLTIAIFFLLMFVGLREWPLLNYAIVMALEALDLIFSFGTLWQILPPLTFLQRELLFDGVAMLETVALAIFAIGFLRIWKRDWLACGIVVAGTVVAFATVVVDFTPNAPIDFAVTLLANLASYAALLIASVRSHRTQGRSAHYFTAAVISFILGYTINMLSAWLPDPRLLVFANQAGDLVASLLLAVALAGKVQAVETQAARDGLTGVMNRRSFDEALIAALLDRSHPKRALGLLLIDIDRFKEFNDTFGHVAGDACLVAVASACAACVREHDIFARYGGEEFGAIIPGTSRDELQGIADRMCAAVAALEIASGGGDGLLSISVGGATMPYAQTLAASDLIRAADAKLYAAKNTGRARVVLA